MYPHLKTSLSYCLTKLSWIQNFLNTIIHYNSCLNPSVAWWHVRAVTPYALPKKQSLIWKEKLLYNIDITNLTVYDLHPRQLIRRANRAVHFTAIISRSRTAVAYLIQIPSLVGATKVFVCMYCGELFLKVTIKHSTRVYLQLPLQQWGAGNVCLLVLSSWKVNIAETPLP